ncbi:MAG: 4Fe-4S dicluster domain-containing protein [Thermoguttaceae bacterium]|nr:4Fe-4S dicluster domain-containing protein [Thermoguttaceae bacterium]
MRETAGKLLAEGTVDVVIGYGRLETGAVGAVFVTKVADVDKLVWNDECHQDLVVYLTRKETKKLGRPAVVVKGCDARAAVVLANESQISLSDVYLIGMVCPGMKNTKAANDASGNLPLYDRCLTCQDRVPRHVNAVIGDEAKTNLLSPEEAATKGNFARLAKLRAMSPQERLDWWSHEFSRCVKCYACRQNCPLCYCNQCVADKNRPVRIDTSSTLKGNFAWNILRAFHLAGRCVGCGACANACPAGIDLDLLNLTLAMTAEKEFGHVSGREVGTAPLIGSFSEQDKEDFIR